MKNLKTKLLLMLILGFTSQLNAQVTIGSDIPPLKAALLDIKDQPAPSLGGITATSGGVLLPRVGLVTTKELSPFFTDTEQNDPDYVATQRPAHKGLFVYNVGNDSIPAGVYVWSGTEWEIFGTRTVIKPIITGLQCVNAYITPSVLTAGVEYTGVLKVPYTGGNGGSYGTVTPILSTGNTGLTAVLQPGTLEYGSGDLVFTLTGTPTNDNTTPAEFNINFLGIQCDASVSGSILGIGETVTFNGSIPGLNTAPGAVVGARISSMVSIDQLPTIDGIVMDGTYAPTADSYSPKIYNLSNETKVVGWNSNTGSDLAATLTPAGTAGDGIVPSSPIVVNWGGSNPPVITTNLFVRITPTIYRWYELKWWCSTDRLNNAKRMIFMSIVRKA